MVVQPARCSLEQPFYYGDVSLSHFFSLNYKGLAHLINKIV